MDHILKAAYFEHRCNACGGTYRVSLHDLLESKRLGSEWVSARPADACHAGFDSAAAAVPQDLLEAVDRAWNELAANVPLPVEVATPE